MWVIPCPIMLNYSILLCLLLDLFCIIQTHPIIPPIIPKTMSSVISTDLEHKTDLKIVTNKGCVSLRLRLCCLNREHVL